MGLNEDTFLENTMMEFAKITIPEPGIILVSVNPVIPTLEELNVFQEAVKENVGIHSGGVTIIDGTSAKLLPAEHRINAGKFNTMHEEFFKEHSAMTVYVLPNMITKMLFRGILRSQKNHPVPYQVVSDLEKAIEIARMNAKIVS
ncbi:MAG TPA: hypothetical protein DCE41_32180 [Cytophagales bacterium]|nr:hypothetical protein [Cytophagales bacterium]HAA19013.1 hypothetical protein [Cytophagales bacterium]HAP61811.1 hypothetical protein [Cytophagales bacterium]